MAPHPFPELKQLPFVFWDGCLIDYWHIHPARVLIPDDYSGAFQEGRQYSKTLARFLGDYPQWIQMNLMASVLDGMRRDTVRARSFKQQGRARYFEATRAAQAGFLSELNQLVVK